MNLTRLPWYLVGLGLVLGGIMLVEVVATAISPFPFTLPVVANFASSLIVIALLVAGGYWLSRSDLASDRYRRVAVWVLGGLSFFSLFALLAVIGQAYWLDRIAVVRWSVSIGASAGMLVGLFEARAIERAVAAERIRMHNEELDRVNDRLEEYASVIAHDLRNPVNVARGYVDTTNEEYDDERLDTAASALDRVEQIIEGTLKLARSGQVIDESETTSLVDLADRGWHTVETAEATLEIDADGSLSADPDRVQQLFENLFRNAVEHGGPTVTLRVGALPDGFFVEDDGPGIPADEREAVLDTGYSTTEDGTGFGLSIVKQIAVAHDWDVDVTEGADGGARFEFTSVDGAPAAEATVATPA